LAKCYNADTKFQELTFFQDKLIQLEKEMARQKVSLWKIVDSLGRNASDGWGRMSEYWVHMRSLKRIVDAVTARGVPTYALAIPMTYDETEGHDIAELGKSITQFKEVLRFTINSWKLQNPSLE
jgi:hypothetical protein